MAVQSGKDLLLKIDMTGTGSFETVAGLRSTRLSFNAETVDVSSLESNGWREMLGGAGLKSASISGSGIFRDEGTDDRMRNVFFNGEAAKFQVILPDFGTIEGPFLISSIEYNGTFNGEAAYDLSLTSAGEITFVEHVAP